MCGLEDVYNEMEHLHERLPYIHSVQNDDLRYQLCMMWSDRLCEAIEVLDAEFYPCGKD